MTTIKVNGKTITIANKSSETLSLESLSKDSIELDNMSKAIESQINAFNIVSNIKAMESIGYKSTEGLGEKLKAGANAVINKFKDWFKKLVEYLKRFRNFIKEKIFKQKISKIKDPSIKSKAQKVANNIDKMSAAAEQSSEKIIAELEDGTKVEAVTVEAVQKTKDNDDNIRKDADEFMKELNSVVDAVCKATFEPLEQELDASKQKNDEALQTYRSILDELDKTTTETSKEAEITVRDKSNGAIYKMKWNEYIAAKNRNVNIEWDPDAK